MAKAAYIDESGGGKICVMECVKSGAGKLMELCKNGWDFASMLASKRKRPCDGVPHGPMRFSKGSEAAVDGDAGLKLLKCSLGRTPDKVGTNSVSKSGRGTGVGDASVCVSDEGKRKTTAHSACRGVYWCEHVCGGKCNASG